LPAALDHPENGWLGFAELRRFRASFELAAWPSAPRGLVNLDFAFQRLLVTLHQLVANLVEHAPGGLVMDSKLPL
jgi:hypothetical protein